MCMCGDGSGIPEGWGWAGWFDGVDVTRNVRPLGCCVRIFGKDILIMDAKVRVVARSGVSNVRRRRRY